MIFKKIKILENQKQKVNYLILKIKNLVITLMLLRVFKMKKINNMRDHHIIIDRIKKYKKILKKIHKIY